VANNFFLDLPLEGGGGAGTVTDVTASSPLASSGGTTPNISLTGIVPVANGGTGLATLTANNVILGNGTSTPSFVAPSTSGNVLTSNGTTWQSTAPAAGGVTTMGTFGSTPNADGASISGSTLTLQPADATNPGGISTTTQTIAGAKTLTATLTTRALTPSAANTYAVGTTSAAYIEAVTRDGFYINSNYSYGMDFASSSTRLLSGAGILFMTAGAYCGNFFSNGNFVLRLGGATAGIGSNNVAPRSIVYLSTASVGNVGSGEDTLATFTLPASTLGLNNGQKITLDAAGSFSADIKDKRLKLHFGSTAIFDSGAMTAPSGGRWRIRAEVVRTSATTQVAFVTVDTNNTVLQTVTGYPEFKATPGETLSGAIVVKCTGENLTDATNDVVVQDYFEVGYDGYASAFP